MMGNYRREHATDQFVLAVPVILAPARCSWGTCHQSNKLSVGKRSWFLFLFGQQVELRRLDKNRPPDIREMASYNFKYSDLRTTNS